MSSKLRDAEEQACSAESVIPAQAAHQAALQATIRSAELYFKALRLADNPQDKKRLDTKVNKLLAQAERLKVAQDGDPRRSPETMPTERHVEPPISERKLTTRENIILLEGAKLNGFVFKPWTGPPSIEEFFHRDGEPLFADSTSLPLSAAQLESFDGWKRPHQALPSTHGDGAEQDVTDEVTIMHLPVGMDLVQDMTSDCSVVASLCALTSRVERGFSKVSLALLEENHP